MRPLTFLLALVMAWVMWGCEEDDTTPPPPPPWLVCDVHIYMPADTLVFLRGDSVSIEGWVVVRGCGGNIVPGVKVDFSLMRPFGLIEFVDPVLGDTTNEVGRVYFRFRSFDQAGTVIIFISCQGHSDQWNLAVLEADEAGVCMGRVTADPDTLWLGEGRADSSLIEFTWSEPCCWDIPECFQFSVEGNIGGSFSFDHDDSTNYKRAWLRPDRCGTCTIVVERFDADGNPAPGFLDRVTVYVDTLR